MGHRTLKRVPLDFNWPLNKVWGGYENPFYEFSHDCSPCDGSGYAPQAKVFGDQWYGKAPFDPVAYGSSPVLTLDSPALRASVEKKIKWSQELARRKEPRFETDYYTRGGKVPFETAVKWEIERMFLYWRNEWLHQLNQADVEALVAGDRLMDFTHTWSRAGGWVAKDPPVMPTAAEVNAWSMSGMGHDGINQMICVRARCRREGVAETCLACNGEGSVWFPEDAEAKADAWEEQEPPKGDGWQLWETTSEGSPISPVFATAELLAGWCAEHASRVADLKATREEWLVMFQAEDGVEQGSAMIFVKREE